MTTRLFDLRSVTRFLATLMVFAIAIPSEAAHRPRHNRHDTTAPTVTSVTPTDGATDVAITSAITAVFNESIDMRSVTPSTFAVSPAVAGAFSGSGSDVRFTPSAPFAAATQYRVSLQGLRDLAGNAMTTTYAFSFVTAAPATVPPPITTTPPPASEPLPQSGSADCGAAEVLCVDDTAGSTQEYSSIQAAVNAAQPGHTVLVHDGRYAGFQIAKSGSASAPIVVRAQSANVFIDNRNASTGDGVRFQNASYVTVEGFTIQGKNSAGTQTITERCVAARGATATSPMTGNVLRNNRCTDSGLEGFYLSQFGNGLVEGNTINGTGRAGGSRNHGIYLANGGADNTVIRGNTISGALNAGSESNGIHMNGDISVGGDGLISGVTIEANTINNNVQSGINMDGVQNTTVRNNVIHGNGRHALRAYAIDGAAGPAALKIVNNTLIASSGWAVKISEDGGGHTLFNNIWQGSSGSLSVGNRNLTSDYNATDGRFSADNEASVVSLTTWQGQTGQDMHSLVATSSALFASGGYRLASGSPARDRGVVSFGGMSAPSTDRVSTVRPQGAGFDMGAYEEIQ